MRRKRELVLISCCLLLAGAAALALTRSQPHVTQVIVAASTGSTPVGGIEGVVTGAYPDEPNCDPNDPNTFLPAQVVSVIARKGDSWLEGVVTDAEGRYSIPNVPTGDYLLYAVGPPFALELAEVTVQQDSNTTADIELPNEEGIITGTVEDCSQTPVAGALVYLHGPNDFTVAAITDLSGNYTLGNLPDGEYDVICKYPHQGLVFEDANGVSVLGGATTSGVSFEATSGAVGDRSVEGRIVDNSTPANPIGEARVRAILNGEMMGSNVSQREDLDEPGAFKIMNLPSDSDYVICVIAAGYALKFLEGISITGEPTNIGDVVLDTAENQIIGTIEDSSESPASDVMISLDCGGVLLTCFSGLDGGYTIKNVPEGAYTVSAIDASGELRFNSCQVVVDESTETLDFQALAEGKVAGRVKDASGGAIEGAFVSIAYDLEAPEKVVGALTDSDGNYTIDHVPAGTYDVYASHSNYSFPMIADVAVAAHATVGGVEFDAYGAAVVVGTVYEYDGTTPVPDCSVRMFDPFSGKHVASATANANGEFEITNIPPSTWYRLDVFDPDPPHSYIAVWLVGTLNNGDRRTSNPCCCGGSISGSLSDGTGGISGASVIAYGTSPGLAVISRRSTTDANGDYTMTRLPTGTYEIRVAAPARAPGRIPEVSVTDGQNTADQDLVLGLGGDIAGTVTDGTNPIARAMVRVTDPSGDPNYAAAVVAFTDESGDYTLSGVLPGDYAVTVKADGYVLGSLTDVHVVAGQTTANQVIALSTTGGGAISGTVSESGSGSIQKAVVFCRKDGTLCGHAVTDENGCYEIADIPAGTYTVTAAAAGYETGSDDSVVVTSGQTAEANLVLTER